MFVVEKNLKSCTAIRDYLCFELLIGANVGGKNDNANVRRIQPGGVQFFAYLTETAVGPDARQVSSRNKAGTAKDFEWRYRYDIVVVLTTLPTLF